MTDISQQLGDGVSEAGESVLKYIFLHDAKRKKKYNLFGAFLELNIYEDLFSPCLSGTVTIVEAFNLISEIPILGDELLEIEYYTPYLGANVNSTKKTFHVTKIDQREHNSDKMNMYVLHFVSMEGVIDIGTKISRSFEGNASEVVQKIYNKELNVGEEIEIDDANNKIEFVSPFWSPFKCINYAASHCLYPNSKIVVPNYLFYQTTKKYKLKSLSNLFKQQPISDYYFDKNPARRRLWDGTSTKDIKREYETIKELYFIQSQDYIKNTLQGSLGHTVFGVDLLRKQFKAKTYQVDQDFNKTDHLDKYYPYSPGAVMNPTGYIERAVTTNDNTDDVLTKRISLLGQLETFKLDIYVPGRSDMEVGMTVNFIMNEFREVDDLEKKGADRSDPYYSGKYLVTAIQHRITQTRHFMMMQIVKDSVKTELKIGEP